jgi:hypothetical protein
MNASLERIRELRSLSPFFLFHIFNKAGTCARMARRSPRIYPNDDGILVAISQDADYFLGIARSLAFVPQALSAATEENRFSQLTRFCQAFAAHVRNGEHFSGLGILHNSRNQPRCTPLQIVNFFHKPCFYSERRTGIPRSLKYRFASAMV